MEKCTLISTIFNEEKSIGKFLKGIASQSQTPDEVVIVDGGSTDNTIQIIERFRFDNPNLNLKLIVDESCSLKNTPGPIARGRNTAINLAQHSLILATDAGCELDKDWVRNISKPFLDKEVSAVAGWYVGSRRNSFQITYESVLMQNSKQAQAKNFLPSSRSIAFYKKVWLDAGKYPENAFAGEDTAFCISILNAGYMFTPALNAIVIWDCPTSLSETFYKHNIYGLGEGQLKVLKLKSLARTLLLFFPIHIILNKEKSKHFLLAYTAQFAHQLGYWKGFVKSFFLLKKF